MAGSIKGVTIEFRGDTTKLDKALREVNKETGKIDKELNKVKKALKFNPNSVELLRQKQTLLNQKLKEARERVDVLKQALKKIESGEVQATAEETATLRRELIEAESKAKNLDKQIKQLGNARLTALSNQLKDIGKKMTKVGTSMTQKVTAPIVAGYTVAAKYASDYEENLNKLDVAFGSNSQAVKDWANTARKEFGLSKVQATDSASAFGALGKGIGLSEKTAADMSMTLAGLSADLGSYFNVGVDESSKALEGIFTGESEALKKFGVVMTDTNLQKFAEDQGLVWKELDQTDKTMLRYQYVLAKTKDAQGDFSRTSDGTANSLKIFQASMQDLGTSIGTALLPMITPIIQKITELVNKFNELSPETQKIITIIGLAVAAAGPLLVILGTLASSVGAIIGLAGTLGVSVGTLVAPILGVVAVIASLVAAGVWLYKNWDTVKAKAAQLKSSVISAFSSLKGRVQAIWNQIKTAITKPIQTAVNIVRNAINRIKNILRGKLSLPKIKLPHFNISGKFSLNPPSVPKLGVKWYDKGGIFDSPSVIGVGEKRPEFVGALDDLRKIVREESVGDNVTFNIYAAPGMDVKKIADAVEQRLVNREKQRRAAWGY